MFNELEPGKRELGGLGKFDGAVANKGIQELGDGKRDYFPDHIARGGRGGGEFLGKVLKIAQSWVGTPYLLGTHVKQNPGNINPSKPGEGETDAQFNFAGSPAGVDCSNFTGAVWREAYNHNYAVPYLNADGVFDVTDTGDIWKSASSRGEAEAHLNAGRYVVGFVTTESVKIIWASGEARPVLGNPWVLNVQTGNYEMLLTWDILRQGSYALMNALSGPSGKVVYDEFQGGTRQAHHIFILLPGNQIAESTLIPGVVNGVRIGNFDSCIGSKLIEGPWDTASYTDASNGYNLYSFGMQYNGLPIAVDSGNVEIVWTNSVQWGWLDPSVF
jgi:hypothetical protein